MPTSVIRIVLANLALPMGAVVYVVVLMATRGSGYGTTVEPFFLAGFAAWAAISMSWIAIWTGVVRWTATRVFRTVVSAAVLAVIGVVLTIPIYPVVVGSGYLDPLSNAIVFGISTLVPLLWVGITLFIWRETADERAHRLAGDQTVRILCPACGYNLGGQIDASCPECGGQYTLAELAAKQKRRFGDDMGPVQMRARPAAARSDGSPRSGQAPDSPRPGRS